MTAPRDGSSSLPSQFDDVAMLEEFMSRPSPELVAELGRLDGDLIVLGVGGKMGPTLARMAQRASPAKRVIGVARFSDPHLTKQLTGHGIECVRCDLLDGDAIGRLPKVRNVVYMAGHKFGSADNASLTWAMNAAVPFMVADAFRESRIVVFSTACVYPYVEVTSRGATEQTPATPPAGDYANSCVGRERMFEHGSRKHQTPGRLVRLSYAIDLRYGVLHDVASAIVAGMPIDLTMGYANVIWQGDANEQALRLLAHCTAPTSPLNVTGPRAAIRELAAEFSRRLGRAPILTGAEAATAWLLDTSESQRMFGPPAIALDTMIDWVAEWVGSGKPSLGKATHFSTRDGNY